MSSALFFLTGAVSGVLLASIVIWYRWKKWQHITLAKFENNLQQHKFELQITLDELAEKNRQLEQQSTLDALTGAFNRGYFDKKMLAEIKRSRREQRPLALILFDIDHFKRINDEYGHLAGDQVLRSTAGLINSCLKRATDQLCRYGGEEFAVILPNTPIEGAVELAEQIRAKLAAAPLFIMDHELSLHLSAGCYAAVAEAGSMVDNYVHNADNALYHAKNNGRNQVCMFPLV